MNKDRARRSGQDPAGASAASRARRPAGLTGHLTTDCRNTLERAARDRGVASRARGCGAISAVTSPGADPIEVFGFVRSIGPAAWAGSRDAGQLALAGGARDASETYCPDSTPGARPATQSQVEVIHRAKVDKDTAGGVVEAHVLTVRPARVRRWTGDRLDARLAAAVMGIQAFKGVEIGMGFEAARLPGSQVHDPIAFDAARRGSPSLGFVRDEQRRGSKGGMTNGAPVVVRGAMKPISTLLRGMPSVDPTAQSTTSVRAVRHLRRLGGERGRGERGRLRDRPRLREVRGDSVRETGDRYALPEPLRRLPLLDRSRGDCIGIEGLGHGNARPIVPESGLCYNPPGRA